MSPVIMDLPPSPAIGHNSQACEVRPAQVNEAAAAKAAYLKMALQGDIGERLRILHHASVSMGHAEFHALWFMLMHGKGNATDVTLGQKKLAMLMECSERQVRRIVTELDGGGWFAPREKQRDARCGKIPDRVMQPLIAELVERSILTGQGIVVPTAIVPQDIERTKMSSRTQVSGSSRTPMSASESPPGHFCQNEPDIHVHRTIEDKPYTRASAGNAGASVDIPEKKINGKEFWTKTLNPMQAKAHGNMHRDPETGDIHVSNGKRQKLEKLLNGRASLEVALSMVKGKISPDASGMWLENRVESVLAEWVLEQEQRDTRAVRGRQQPARAAGGMPEREDNCPDHVWRLRVKSHFDRGLITQEEAIKQGLVL